MDESVLDVSQTRTHTPRGLSCPVPSPSVVRSGTARGAAGVGAWLLLAAGVSAVWLPRPRPLLILPVPQDSTYLDDLSNASIFSSSVDSLSDIADTPDFLPADSLSQVPTIWDVSTGPSAQDKVSAL